MMTPHKVVPNKPRIIQNVRVKDPIDNRTAIQAARIIKSLTKTPTSINTVINTPTSTTKPKLVKSDKKILQNTPSKVNNKQVDNRINIDEKIVEEDFTPIVPAISQKPIQSTSILDTKSNTVNITVNNDNNNISSNNNKVFDIAEKESTPVQSVSTNKQITKTNLGGLLSSFTDMVTMFSPFKQKKISKVIGTRLNNDSENNIKTNEIASTPKTSPIKINRNIEASFEYVSTAKFDERFNSFSPIPSKAPLSTKLPVENSIQNTIDSSTIATGTIFHYNVKPAKLVCYIIYYISIQNLL